MLFPAIRLGKIHGSPSSSARPSQQSSRRTIFCSESIASASQPTTLLTRRWAKHLISGQSFHHIKQSTAGLISANTRYYDFHPAPVASDVQVSPKTHGLVPVWGFGTVVMSSHPRVLVGERVYGYLAPTRYLVLPVSPSDVNKHAFYVPRPHLPAGTSFTGYTRSPFSNHHYADRRPYNQFLRCGADTQYDPSPQGEDLTMLYRPLFWTSFWCEDWFFKSGYREANNILISSASSKTAFCLAYLIRKRFTSGEILPKRIIGLTSKRNLAFTTGLGLYDDVVDYDSFPTSGNLQISDGDRWLYVDVSANDALNKSIFAHFGSGDRLVASIALGMTNLSPSTPNASSANWTLNTFVDNDDKRPRSPSLSSMEQFFMVEWLNVRKHQLKPREIHLLQDSAWREFMKDCVGWVKLERVLGAEAVKRAYERLAKGGLGPDQGFIWSLWDGDNNHVRTKM